MELKKLLDEERAVSPVIATVLMITVTVIIAAIVAAFALGLGGAGDATPQASFEFDWDGATTLTITHEGGDALEAASVTVFVDGGAATAVTDWPDAEINTGERYVTDSTATPALGSGVEVRVTWTSEDGKEATLAVYEVP